MSLPTDPTWLTASWTTVKFAELGDDHGYERGQNERGPWARKPYLVASADVNTFSRNLRGLSSLSGGLGSPWVITQPLLFPDDPTDNIYCTGISVKYVGDITGSLPITYTYAIVTVAFTPLTWDASAGSDPGGDNSFGETEEEIAALMGATQEMDFGYQEIPIPASAILIGGVKTNQPAVLRLALVTMNITWERLPYLPMSAVRAYAGSVNQGVFLGCPDSSVMFDGARSSRQVGPDGTVLQRVQMSFRFRSQSFNNLLNAAGNWQAATNQGGQPLYTKNDFSQLLL